MLKPTVCPVATESVWRFLKVIYDLKLADTFSFCWNIYPSQDFVERNYMTTIGISRHRYLLTLDAAWKFFMIIEKLKLADTFLIRLNPLDVFIERNYNA